jgi:hypothetical protein
MNLAEMMAAKAVPGAVSPVTTAAMPAGFPMIRPAGATPVPQATSAEQLLAARSAMLAASKPRDQRNSLLNGTGLYLIKDGKYKVTDKGMKLTAFALYCVKGVSDSQGLTPASTLYTGPIVGEVYDYAVFHEGKYPDRVLETYISIFAACMGWTVKQVTDYQQTVEGQTIVRDMIKGIMGVDLAFVPTNQPCTVANQVIVEINKQTKMVDKKVDKQVAYDATGKPIQVKAENVYWNKRVWFNDPALATLTEQDIVRAFGSIEAAKAAAETEKQFKAALQAG